MNSSSNAIILFSGGLDSTTCLAIAKAAGFHCYALSFAYGQKHAAELAQAKKIAANMGVKEHKILNLPLDQIGGSSLTDKAQTVPDFKPSSSIPSTYVPARNTIFLSFALGYGEVVGAHDIFIGANIVDYSGYPDCRPEYLHAFEQLAKLATKDGVDNQVSYKIHSPLLQWNKAEIIKHGVSLGIDYSQTVSCYRANEQGKACGSCDSCAYRKKGFLEAGVADPTMYA